MQSYTFVLKHKGGKSNKVVAKPSRRHLLLTEMQIEVVGFKELTNLYMEDLDFSETWKACTVPVTLDRTKMVGFHNLR